MERILTGTDFEGRYRIDEELGAGGVGTVFRATHLKLNRAVAIKVLQEKYGASRELRQRFEREAYALAALSHPHVVTVTDYGVSHGMPYLVMELLEGETLADRLDAGPLHPSDAMDVVKQLLKALIFVHDRGLVHRDMKPGNIFLQKIPGSKPHVKVLDFGLAKFLEQNETATALTRTGQVFGTPSYMAPEQIGGEGTDARTDIYAAGIILFEMLAGRPPFRGNVAEVMRQHLIEPLPTVESIRPDRKESAELRALVERATAKSRDARYQTAQEMSDAIEALPSESLLTGLEGVHSARTVLEPTSGRAAAQETGRYVATSENEEIRGRPVWVHVAPPVIALLGLTVFVVALKRASPDSDVADVNSATQSMASRKAERAVPAKKEDNPKPVAPTPATAPPAPPTAEASAAPVPSEEPSAESPPDPAPPAARTSSIQSAAELWRGSPKVLRAALEALDRKEKLSRRTFAYIYEHNSKNRGDPRGHLVLARAYVAKGWRKDATNEYGMAYKLNPDVTVDPRMLPDLLDIAVHGSQAAEELLKEAFGSQAISAVDAKLSTVGPNRLLEERLRELRKALVAHGH